HPTLPEGARLLLLNESDDPVWDDLVPLLGLSYRDLTIRVDRARKMRRKIDDNEMAAYDHLLDYRDGRLVEPFRMPDPRLNPVVSATPQGPEIYHADWSPVTVKSPARRGEILI